jgi:hypothetical protein
MAKKSGGGLKLRQRGMVRDKPKKTGHKKAQKAPWSDPLKHIARGGSRH